MIKVNFKHLTVSFMTEGYEESGYSNGFYYYDEGNNLVIVEEKDPNHQTIFHDFINIEVEGVEHE